MKPSVSNRPWLSIAAFAVLSASTLLRASDAPATFAVGEFLFTRPADWQWIETSGGMRAAELRITGTDASQMASVTFFHFGAGMGGGVDANVARWLGQFAESPDVLKPSIDKGLMGAVPITFVKARGTFNSGMPGQPTTPMPDYALHGAILESKQGDVFVKMTGPSAIVDSAGAAFDKFIKDAAASVAK
jgi:hypothetical protein